ncbi:4-hydroxy-tetrahydrodipicolinate reductase [Lactovum miscens]|uniref:4-hydroxy-tetrahydrodipicolinate reductase n=1 Tax=Lactovum miscens TaxID=190387 RepID=A0A841C6U9_9LACT|nr:4-hydroxy-tetrahydrodipicolinate reductase [Lactovum miscens]MBB5887322.1 4-hydroxy-tetrahydrodipicolinate reductase [Lactovum miscens]
MKYLIIGEGSMGQLIKQELMNKGHQVDSVSYSKEIPKEQYDGLVDFSHPDNLRGIISHLSHFPSPIVIATTGYTVEQVEEIHQLSNQVSVIYSGNYSVGIIVMKRLIKEMQTLLGKEFDIEIIEKHHNKKLDAPSGTAKMLAETLLNQDVDHLVYGREGVSPRHTNEIGIHSVRGGSIVGEHEVIFAGQDEILSMKHEAHSKMIFVNGAVRALIWLGKQAKGIYTMDDVIFGKKD